MKKVLDGFEPILRAADFIHWMEEKHPEILKEYEKTIEEIDTLTKENVSLKERYNNLLAERASLIKTIRDG